MGETSGVLRRWTVVTWNLHGSASPPLGTIAEEIRSREQVDVLVAQEVRRGQARDLARRLGWRHVWYRKHHPYSPLLWWRTEGMAVFTPHRIAESGATSISPGVSTWSYRHRIVVQVLVQRSDASGHRIVDLHLASDADGADERTEQARRAAQIIATLESSRSPAPVVVAGDLNDDGEAAVVEILAGDGRRVDGWTAAAERSPGDGATCSADSPTQRLDHVLVPATATVLAAHVPEPGARWAAISDHLPLTVTFESEWVEPDWPTGQMRSQ